MTLFFLILIGVMVSMTFSSLSKKKMSGEMC